MLRLWIWPLLAFAAVLIPGAVRAEPAPARIVAVGDIHGDHDAWLADRPRRGIGRRQGPLGRRQTTLVQLGDVVDRGPDSLKIIRHLMKLQREAPRKGGRVIVLVGNHEAMNDDWRPALRSPGRVSSLRRPGSQGAARPRL